MSEDSQVAELRRRAEQGDGGAQCNLGVRYSTGDGVEKDEAQAVKWYRMAAQQGIVAAQFNLGLFYYQARGVQRDLQEAAHWYRTAADQGHARSQITLALLYETGEGVPRDEFEAIMWHRRAAEQGEAFSLRRLGMAYDLGLLVRKDLVEAHAWTNLAHVAGDAEAKQSLIGIQQQMTPVQVAEAVSLASDRWEGILRKTGKLTVDTPSQEETRSSLTDALPSIGVLFHGGPTVLQRGLLRCEKEGVPVPFTREEVNRFRFTLPFVSAAIATDALRDFPISDRLAACIRDQFSTWMRGRRLIPARVGDRILGPAELRIVKKSGLVSCGFLQEIEKQETTEGDLAQALQEYRVSALSDLLNGARKRVEEIGFDQSRREMFSLMAFATNLMVTGREIGEAANEHSFSLVVLTQIDRTVRQVYGEYFAAGGS